MNNRIVFVFSILCHFSIMHLATSTTTTIIRSKRTIGMLDRLIDTMRETFAPATSPTSQVIVKYPMGVKYMYYPTVRMRITPIDEPIERHIIIMKHSPAIRVVPATMRAPKPIAPPSQVELIQPIRPATMIRVPKTNTAAVRYKIVPMSVMPTLKPAFASEAALRSHNTPKDEDEARLSWLRQPFPQFPSFADSFDEPNKEPEPWNLLALPPPMATKRPRMSRTNGVVWSPKRIRYKETPGPSYVIPIIEKQITISNPKRKFSDDESRSESEMPQSPATLEAGAFSENMPVTSYPDEIQNRLMDKGPQKFDHSDQRRVRRQIEYPNEPIQKRDSSNRVKPFANDAQLLATSSENTKFPQSFKISTRINQREPRFWPTDREDGSHWQTARTFTKSEQPSVGYHDVNSGLDFGEFSDNEEADRDADTRESGSTTVSMVKGLDWVLGNAANADERNVVFITPRPTTTLSGRAIGTAQTQTQPAIRYVTKIENDSSFDNTETRRRLYEKRLPKFFDSVDESSDLKFPDTGFFTKRRHKDDFPDISLTGENNDDDKFVGDDFFKHGFKDGNDRFKSNNNFFGDWTGRKKTNDFERIEYFEPIVIDIDGDNYRKNNDRGTSKFGKKKSVFKRRKNLGKIERAEEPLKLPTSLHETVDYLRNTMVVHPPIFDLDEGANELSAVAVFDGNEIT